MTIALAILWLAQVADILTTRAILRGGGRELNPLLGSGARWLVIAKVLVAGGITWAALTGIVPLWGVWLGAGLSVIPPILNVIRRRNNAR